MFEAYSAFRPFTYARLALALAPGYSSNRLQRMDRGKTPLRIAAAVAAVASSAALAMGCGGGGGIEGGSNGPATEADASGPVQGKLTISQWPLYIDPGKN